jgi:hypothetical protein
MMPERSRLSQVVELPLVNPAEFVSSRAGRMLKRAAQSEERRQNCLRRHGSEYRRLAWRFGWVSLPVGGAAFLIWLALVWLVLDLFLSKQAADTVIGPTLAAASTVARSPGSPFAPSRPSSRSPSRRNSHFAVSFCAGSFPPRFFPCRARASPSSPSWSRRLRSAFSMAIAGWPVPSPAFSTRLPIFAAEGSATR